MTAIFSGFLLGFSLILAIGAQNAFVLRQGLRREHVLAVCLVCALSDVVLIAAGVAGFGSLSRLVPWFSDAMRWVGAAFLLAYGAMSLRRAFRGSAALSARRESEADLSAAVATALALTWLNPHVYLDTVVLLGSVSAQSDDRLLFGVGAAAASFAFFFSLGYGARLLAPLFARAGAWQILDLGIAMVMWAIAARLLVM